MVSSSKNIFVFKFLQNAEKFKNIDFVDYFEIRPESVIQKNKKDLRFQLGMKGSGSKSRIFVAAMIFFGVLHCIRLYMM